MFEANIACGIHRRLAGNAHSCYIQNMSTSAALSLPAGLASELERKFFWWENVTTQPRSHLRILAQAMNFASFEDVLRLENILGADQLVDAMLKAQPGWL